ncbi:hypothetical protein TCAL_12677 [Tigriopus californicus]|uniref:Uncharacterized protein n=1 Tax=Tigriopus californicus TaxID=6832 RepID=A0A553PTX8_TIGCA|nr:hypothetical protein TCAL_12677 [Tigriopus californicus]
MPRPVVPPTLYTLALRNNAQMLYQGLRAVDQLWEPPKMTLNAPRSSPSGSPHNLSTSQLFLAPLSSEEEQEEQQRLNMVQLIRDWLMQTPTLVMEDLIASLLKHTEKTLNDDRDQKLIKALINIERMKVSDIFFGVHALFAVLVDTPISKLEFSAKLWVCLWDYEQIMQSSYIHDRVCESLPRMRNLVQINLPQVATDKLCFLISEHLPLIRELNLDHSRVTDKGIKFLCGIKTLMGKSSPSEGQSQSSDVDQALQEQAALSVWHATTTESTMVARSISFESPCTTSSPIGSPGGSAGREKYCSQIQKLSLDGCLNLSESVIWLALKKLNTLKMLKYHHAFSVAEIMNKELNNLSSEEVAQLHFKLIHYNHPFPYGINVPTSLVQRISAVCPNITELNIVTEDSCVEAFSHMKHLKSVSIELEDWFGLGLFGFLKTMGSQIQELAISCSSDAEASFPPGGGQAFQLFNTGLKLARALCDPDSLKKLNIAGRCVKLQCLSLEGNFSSFMTHGFIMSLLAKNPLEQLGIFDIGGADIALGPQTALLLLKLPNILELRLSTWKLSDQDFNSLKTFVKDHGFHVYLTRGGPSHSE